MKKRKLPYRTCILTKESLLKDDLFRIVKNKGGKIFVDLTGKANGRGAYLKKDKAVIEEARKRKVLNGVFKEEVDDKIYLELLDNLDVERK